MQGLVLPNLFCLLNTKQKSDSKAYQEMYKGKQVWLYPQ